MRYITSSRVASSGSVSISRYASDLISPGAVCAMWYPQLPKLRFALRRSLDLPGQEFMCLEVVYPVEGGVGQGSSRFGPAKISWPLPWPLQAWAAACVVKPRPVVALARDKCRLSPPVYPRVDCGVQVLLVASRSPLHRDHWSRLYNVTGNATVTAMKYRHTRRPAAPRPIGLKIPLHWGVFHRNYALNTRIMTSWA